MTIRHCAIAALTSVASLVCLPGLASADPLEGVLTDALTGYPVEGGLVRVAGTTHEVTTDAQGRWAFDLPRGVYQIDVDATLGAQAHHVSLVRQHVPQYKPAHARLYTTWYSDQGVPTSSTPMGVPTTSGALPSDAPDSIKLPMPSSNPLHLTVSDPIPRRIRVGRRERPEEGCRDNPIIAIEEMDIDEYVKGVLPPEIGVFRSIPGALETYKAFGVAAKSYGLWFMLTYDESNRRVVDAPLPPDNHTWFHIDDTACNQRYSDERLTLTTQAADAIANQILVKKGEPGTLDKLEYAASCGRHGTLPEYGTTSALVPDVPPINGCAGSWCGHDTCAGHEDNPNLAGSDRCLVRGICQWGTASWGESGKDYLWILSHYQPNLELRDLQGTEPVNDVEVRGYVYTLTEDIPGSALPGMNVALSDGQSTTTDAQGTFSFSSVPLMLGNVTLTASGSGYITTTQDKQLTAGEINWASVLIVPEGGTALDMGAPRDMGSTQDMAAGPTRDMGQGSTPGDQGGTPSVDQGQSDPDEFDELLTTSSGIEGGCTQSAPGKGSPVGPGLLGLLGLLWARRKSKPVSTSAS